MGYTNANNLLPRALVREVQQYVDGAYLYIPRKDGEKRPWGGKTGIRKILLARNREIVEKRRAGYTVAELSAEYFLADKTVSRIIASAKHA
jgi:Mor family transcriptional regulator